jgi:hypothetical protein
LVLHFDNPPHDVPRENVVTGKETAPELYRDTSSYDECLFPSLITEIQLKNIVDRLQSEKKDTKTDGDETMVHNGVVISKFSCEALGLGEHVADTIKNKIYKRFKQWASDDSVFPTKNGSPKILTKFVNQPYSYELLPEYERGEKKLTCVKAMNWEGKTYTAHVSEVLLKGHPPGQPKDDPNHGFRVCVNALINKCLKPCASTIPLATDKIRKLFNCKYFLQLDGMNAYWSIPLQL